MEKGDLQTGFAESDYVIEGEMRVGGQVRYIWSDCTYDLACQISE